jgi:hypothetical protein
VLDKLEDEYQDYSPSEKLHIVEGFNSSFWNSGHLCQRSSLSFEEFCKQRDMRRGLIVNCDYYDYSNNFRYMFNHLSDSENDNEDTDSNNEWGSEKDYDDSDSNNKWGEEQTEESPENPPENVGVASNVDNELGIRLSAKLSALNEPFNYTMGSHSHDRDFPIVDDLALPVGSDDGFDSRNFDGNNRYIDIANTYWENPFDVGASSVGSPVISLGKFMDLDIPDAYWDRPFQQ